MDREIHRAEGYTHYTIFSLWDTYRALHPWLTIFQPRRAGEMVRSMLDHYRHNSFGILPIWSFHANETWCMTGYHGVSVIADAAVKGIQGFDPNLALQAAVASATCDGYGGLEAYSEHGYLPFDHPLGDNSASKTLEYAYDDFAVFRLAEKLGRRKIAEEFRRRARNYQNLFDPDTGFIRARDGSGQWLRPFDPLETSGMGYIEGNAWNYSLHVPHDIRGYIDLLGGPGKLEKMLDTIFTMDTPESAIAGSEDITRRGILGGYIHGNEPGHHLPYLYNYVGAPWKTQRLVRRILAEMYTDAPDGIPGNDDTGQMSAWYVFGTLGFYPVCPGTDQYVLGSPGAPGAVLHLENGKDFIIRTENWSPQNLYIQQVLLNGTPLTRTYIRHREITAGGELLFVLGPRPNHRWGTGPDGLPFSLTGE
jgi:predicted alpha-1,2-mannosidase